MCLIVDACRSGIVFGRPSDGDVEPIWVWLRSHGGCLVFGGSLAAELSRNGAAAKLLAELKRSGRAIQVEGAALVEDEAALRSKARLRSNDPHVLALARVTGARVLHTNDRDLIADFKDPAIVARPRGKVYLRAEHADLLTHSRGCPRHRRRRSGRE